MRIAIYEMSHTPPRFATEVTVDDGTTRQTVEKFWRDHNGLPGHNLLVIG